MILHHTPPALPHTGGRRWRIREGGNTDFWLVGRDVERATRRALIGWGLVASTIPAPRICWDHRRRHPPNISSDSRRSALGWLPNHVRMQDTQVVSCFFAFHFLASTKKKNLDRYLNLNIARAPSPKKLGQWSKKAFELFTQKNIRRNLIAADHMRQINQGIDVLHLPTAVGVLSD